jgi:hypothetical protein
VDTSEFINSSAFKDQMENSFQRKRKTIILLAYNFTLKVMRTESSASGLRRPSEFVGIVQICSHFKP